MQMSHPERIRWCKEISKINSKLNDEPKNMFEICSKKYGINIAKSTEIKLSI